MGLGRRGAQQPLPCSPEMMNWTGESIRNLMLSLEVLTWFIIAIFILEIGLSWVVDFRGYWHNIWNIFDFSITVLVRLGLCPQGQGKQARRRGTAGGQRLALSTAAPRRPSRAHVPQQPLACASSSRVREPVAPAPANLGRQ